MLLKGDIKYIPQAAIADFFKKAADNFMLEKGFGQQAVVKGIEAGGQDVFS